MKAELLEGGPHYARLISVTGRHVAWVPWKMVDGVSRLLLAAGEEVKMSRWLPLADSADLLRRAADLLEGKLRKGRALKVVLLEDGPHYGRLISVTGRHVAWVPWKLVDGAARLLIVAGGEVKLSRSLPLADSADLLMRAADLLEGKL